VTVAILVAGALVLWGRRSQLDQGLQLAGRLSGWWLLAAVAAEGASLVSFALVQRRLLGARAVAVPALDMIRLAMAGNGISNVLPGGSVVAAAWTWRQFRTRGATRSVASWALLVSGAISSIALTVMIIAGTEIAGDHGPVASLRWVGVALAVGGLAAGGLMYACRGRTAAWIDGSKRLSHLRATLALGEVSVWDWAVAGGLSLLNWLLDLACLVACTAAIGVHISWPTVVAAYGLSQLLNALPLTPGGVGLIEAGLTALLVAYGMPATAALATVIVYRAVSFWAPTPLGLVLWAQMHRVAPAPAQAAPTSIVPVAVEPHAVAA
jgi:uncharacterized membrane protein YbhN (UPF0104 family)